MYENVRNLEELDQLILDYVNMDDPPQLSNLEFKALWFSDGLRKRINPTARTINSAFCWSDVMPGPGFWSSWDGRLDDFAKGAGAGRRFLYTRENLIYRIYPINRKGERLMAGTFNRDISIVADLLSTFSVTQLDALAQTKTERDTKKSYWEFDLSNLDHIKGVICESCDAMLNNHIELSTHKCARRYKKYER